MDDTTTLVKLKYFPIQPTRDYFLSLPGMALNKTWKKYYGEYAVDTDELVRLFSPLSVSFYNADVDNYVNVSRKGFQRLFIKDLEQNLVNLYSTQKLK